MTWTKCSDELPPIRQKVIVAWDNSAPPEFQGTHHSAVMRDDLPKIFSDDPEWDWICVDSQEPFDWGDDQYPTHWMPWPEFRP